MDMLSKFGEKFTLGFQKLMPDAFVFAILLTLAAVMGAYFIMDRSPLDIIDSWYTGFFDLLAFGMQIVLIIITGYSIALSATVKTGIDQLTRFINTPIQVYFFVVCIGVLLSLISFGFIVITCFLARELAMRIKGINYPFLIACVYFSFNSWVLGLSSTIPLLLNTSDNYLIENGVLDQVIPTAYTLGSTLNIAMIGLLVFVAPILMVLLRPKSPSKSLEDLLTTTNENKTTTIQAEAQALKLPFNAISDRLNNGVFLQAIIVIMGLVYIGMHFYNKGLDLDLNIMIFIFLILGMLLHKTPMRYVIAMKRASTNVSGVLFQYPFYAGIMGIMLYSGLGQKMADILAAVATIETYPFYAYITGGLINFAIPSAGGEFAVVGPSIIEAVKALGAGLPAAEVNAMIAKASLSVAYGESLSNMMQPFFLLLVMPIMAAGTSLKARDIMGYLVLPVLVFFVVQVLMILVLPI